MYMLLIYTRCLFAIVHVHTAMMCMHLFCMRVQLKHTLHVFNKSQIKKKLKKNQDAENPDVCICMLHVCMYMYVCMYVNCACLQVHVRVYACV